MNSPDTLSRFAQDELTRSPALLDGALAGTIQGLTHPPAESPPAHRLAAAEVGRLVAALRPRMVAAYSGSLRSLLQAGPAASPAAPIRPTRSKASLALVEEEAVVSDVEIHRAADVIRTAAEHELRELATFLSTLAGAAHVAKDHNRLGPDAHAQALWAAALLLPPDGNTRSIFMRQASTPLAAGLRKAYAAACSRLEDAGVTPAAYRTVVLPAGVRADTAAQWAGSGTATANPGDRSDAAHLLEQLLQRVQALPAAHGSGPAAHQAQAAPSTPTPAAAPAVASTPSPSPSAHTEPSDAQAALETLFDALLTKSGLADDFKPAVSRLQVPAARLAQRDSRVLQDPEHPVWRLIDRIAWQAELLPPAPHRERVRTAQVIEGLVDQMAKVAEPEMSLFEWAIERLLVLERNRLERLVARHTRHCAALAAAETQLLAARGAELSEHGALDIGQLQTVPAELFDAQALPPDTSSPAERWLDRLRTGDVARLLLQGRWVQAQLLWTGRRREISLWADCCSDQTWPIRRGALRLLRQEDRTQPVTALRMLDTLSG